MLNSATKKVFAILHVHKLFLGGMQIPLSSSKLDILGEEQLELCISAHSTLKVPIFSTFNVSQVGAKVDE